MPSGHRGELSENAGCAAGNANIANDAASADRRRAPQPGSQTVDAPGPGRCELQRAPEGSCPTGTVTVGFIKITGRSLGQSDALRQDVPSGLAQETAGAFLTPGAFSPFFCFLNYCHLLMSADMGWGHQTHNLSRIPLWHFWIPSTGTGSDSFRLKSCARRRYCHGGAA